MAFPANFKKGKGKKGKGKLAKKAEGKATGKSKNLPPWLAKKKGDKGKDCA